MLPAISQNKTIRNTQIATDRIVGLTYRELASKYDLSKGAIEGVLRKTEIKTFIDGGTNHFISLIPKAIDIQTRVMESTDKIGDPTALALKASENVLKTGSIMPSNVTNQTVNQVFNIQNNVTLSPGVANAMGIALDNDDEDVFDVTPEDV